MDEAEKWLQEHGIQCLKKKDKALIHPRHCAVESAKEIYYLKSMCEGCERYVKPTAAMKKKRRVVFGDVNIGKRKSIQRTPSVKGTIP